MLINADLHIHSPFSGGSSSNMNFHDIAEGAIKKGLHVVATGDCLHPFWQMEIKKGHMVDGLFEINGVYFILSTEVEDVNRVHHLILFPDFDSVHELRENITRHSPNIDEEGRAKVMLSGGELLDIAIDCNALLGAAHAFTPWTSLYAYFDSIKYYGKKPFFLELGLSADSGYADRLKELHSITFLSNSDSHSPLRLGREFNRLEVQDISWDEMEKAIRRRGGRRIVLNAGFPPEKGKYNRTACCSCYRQYSIEEAKKLKWKCHCNGRIKKGVRDRIDELADFKVPFHSEHRGKYIHILPLAEIIANALRMNVHSKTVKRRWEELLKLGNEINILLDVDMDEIRKVTPSVISSAIEKFRKGKIKIQPGGGGKYGEIIEV